MLHNYGMGTYHCSIILVVEMAILGHEAMQNRKLGRSMILRSHSGLGRVMCNEAVDLQARP